MRKIRTNFNLSKDIKDKIPWVRSSLLNWFKNHGRDFAWRKPNISPYELLVAEILLQRTPAASVAKVFPRFINRYPSWDDLKAAYQEDLELLLRPLGLWRLKAQIFLKLSRAISEQSGLVPATRGELEKHDGIGQYTASAVLAIFHGAPEPLLDVNMARVLERVFGPRERFDIRDDPYLQTLSREVVKGHNNLNVNWAILDLGALICKPLRPRCNDCPLQTNCLYFTQIKERTDLYI
ncbi:MAG: hypothetical protein IT327_28600 [Anaerolineae bacterium]|nr:hypothetical protein [Anaerolineae bacterium]